MAEESIDTYRDIVELSNSQSKVDATLNDWPDEVVDGGAQMRANDAKTKTLVCSSLAGRQAVTSRLCTIISRILLADQLT
jgi:hypothetical protein